MKLSSDRCTVMTFGNNFRTTTHASFSTTHGMPAQEFYCMSVNDDNSVFFGGETVFANNTAICGGTSVKRIGFYCISGNAKHRFPRENIPSVTIAPP